MKHLRYITEKEVDLDKQEHPTVLDFDDNLPDTRKFISKHKVNKHEDRVKNDDTVFDGSKVKYSLKTPQNSRMGRDGAKSRAANEEAISEAKSYHNIEPHPTRKGLYIGYADGPWHVKKTGYGGWEAHKRQGDGYIRGKTLDDISSDLNSHSSKRYTKEEVVNLQPKTDTLTRETIRMLIQKAEQNLGEKNKATTETLLKAKSQNEGYIGFKALAAKVGPGAAAAIGRKKYGKAKFDHAAATGTKMKGMKPAHEEVVNESKIENPNSCGQGYCKDHENHPVHGVATKMGYTYSHSTPIGNRDNPMYIHHTWEKGEHKIGAGSHNFSKWNTTTTTASGRKQHGEGMDSLEKHLKGKKKRFKELRESDQKEQYN